MNPIRIMLLCGVLLFLIFDCDFCEQNPAYVAFENCLSTPATGCLALEGTIAANELANAEGTPVNYEKIIKNNNPPSNPPPTGVECLYRDSSDPVFWTGSRWILCDHESGTLDYWNGSAWVHFGNIKSGAECSQPKNWPDCSSVETPVPIPPLLNVCTPPALTLDSANGWCANFTSKTGGVTINMSGERGINWGNDAGVTCTAENGQYICSGPQNASFPISTCTYCGGGFPSGQGPTSDKDFGDYTCSTGYVTDPANGNCKPATSGYPDGACPTGSHFDNSQQWCVDNTTNQKVTNLCPAGSVAYLPGFHVCLLKPLPSPMRFNCQTWTITTGDCTLQRSNSGPAPVKPPCISSTAGCH